jgi:hypothetical protein
MAPRIRFYGLSHLRDEQAPDDLIRQVLITTLQAQKNWFVKLPAACRKFHKPSILGNVESTSAA